MNVAQITRFAVVGIAQNSINVAVFAGLHSEGVTYSVSAILAAVIALIVSFILHRHWTFARTAGGTLRGHAVRYGVVFGTSVLAGIGILALQIEVLRVPAVLAQAVAIVLVAPASFVAQRRWVFA
jgi:putative flippase GtrA